MRRGSRIVWWAMGGLVGIDWLAKIWLLSAFWCATCVPESVVLTSDSPPVLPAKRISAAGVSYGDCAGVTFAVLLFPEPCGWDGATPYQRFAIR
jgi:hypothetical protein